MAGSMVYRFRVGSLDDPHMVTFREAMGKAQAISDNRGFNHIAGFHGAPDFYCWHHQRNSNSPIQARLFLPWHRAYMWWLEQALQDRVAGAALPWWGWTTQRDVPTSYATAEVGGNRNPLFNSLINVPSAGLNRYTRRNPGLAGFLATEAQVNTLLEDSDFASFSDQLQSFHDMVHVWVGGDMGSVATAGFDPIFFAHHTMIDRLWYLWQVKWGENRIPGELLEMELVPFGKRVKDVLSVQALGYEYATSAVSADVSDTGGMEPAEAKISLDFGSFSAGADCMRIDLEIYGVDHSQLSYQGMIFINNRDVTPATASDQLPGYAGSFAVFGHGGCFGDAGHCDIVGSNRRFDTRPGHPLTPAFKRIPVTDLVKAAIADGKAITVTIIGKPTDGGEKITDTKILKISGVQIVGFGA